MNNAPPPLYDQDRLETLAATLIETVQALARRGWTPATSSNFSCRLDDRHILITVSGRDKNRLTRDDLMLVDYDGNPVDSESKPSAETLLHTRLYQRHADIACILHTHSLVQTVASRLFASQGHVNLSDYELLKALHGNATHEAAVNVPVFANTQDIAVLAAQIDTIFDHAPMWGYLIDGHGLYTWGVDIAEACRHLEALEFLLHCELELHRLNMPPT